jgi:replication factor C small subunit
MNMTNLLFYGRAGIGKTTAALVLAKEILDEDYHSNFLELNASDDRKLETIREIVKDFASTGKMGDVPYKICLLDEIDGMTNAAQNALKRIMEKYAKNIRFILTCNLRWKVIDPLQSRCAVYCFKPLTSDELNRVILSIAYKEIEDITFDAEEKLYRRFEDYTDVRQAITDFQKNPHEEKPIEEYTYKDILINFSLEWDNVENAHSKLLEYIEEGITIEEICRNLHDAVFHIEVDNRKKYQLLKVIGETEYRGKTMTPRIAVSWLCSQIIK